MENEKSAFRVIIVGCSITGMTLAHCLDRAGIDYVILEKHHDIMAEPGISIGLMPNGSRILEQLGMYSTIDKLHEPIKRMYSYFPDGFCIEADSPTKVVEKFGLPFCVMERQKFLDVLYAEFKDKSRIHTGEKVVQVCHDDSGVSVLTADGVTYNGDLIVGADGIHSVVRSEMWRVGNLEQPGFITEQEKTGPALSAEFACVFGISGAVPGVDHWEHVLQYNKDFCFMIFPATRGRIFFNVVFRMDKKHSYPNIPRFSEEDAFRICDSYAHFPVWKDVTFGDIWAQRHTYAPVPLEEHMYKTWHFRRIICIGDSVSKMCPNMGQGGNTAIETAAALTNGLRILIQAYSPGKVSERALSKTLERLNREQLKRLDSVHGDSWFVTRLEALDGMFEKTFARYIMQYCGDLLVGNLSRIVAAGSVLDFIPLTVRSGKDWPPCPRQHSWGIFEALELCKNLAIAFIVSFVALLARYFLR